MLLGNEVAYNRLKKSIEGKFYPILVSGPYGVGKQTACSLLADSLGYNINVISKTDVLSSVRDTQALKQDDRINVFDNVESYSDSAQDALLKICEEINEGLRIILVTSDIGKVSLPLLSRARSTVLFKPISKSDLQAKFKNKPASDLSNGSYAICQRMTEKPSFLQLHEVLTNAEKQGLVGIPKSLFSEIGKMEVDVETCKAVLTAVARDSCYGTKYLELARRYSSCPSIDLELHAKSIFIDVI